jgi:hypothetical protein
MGNFKTWLEGNEQADVRKTIAKLPKRHQALVKGYHISFEGGNTMKGDGEHIGLVQDSPRKSIVVAAPWNYGREYALLHEVAHLVWATFMNEQMKQHWQELVNHTKDKQHQNAEELFCMAYANHYANNKIVIHTHPEWEQFIAKLPS